MVLIEGVCSILPPKWRCSLLCVVTLFAPMSAFMVWTKIPSNPSIGVLIENATLEWNYKLAANEVFDYFLLTRLENSRFKDAIKYNSDGTITVYGNYKQRFSLAKNGTPALFIFRAELSDSTEYCCKIATSGQQGKTNESCVDLKILVRAGIKAISGNKTLNETNDVTLFCNATGDPPPNITWSKGGVDLKTSSQPALSLKNISRKEDGLYWCTADNGVGKTNASVLVVVNFAPLIIPLLRGYNFTEGNDVELKCDVDGKPPPTVTWTKLGDVINRVNSTGQKLLIKKANRTDAGTYKCTARNGIGNDATTTTRINMLFPPRIDERPRNHLINETTDLQLFCNATGNPPPNIKWSRLPDSSIVIITGEALIIQNVNKTDAGIYQCKASNGVGHEVTAISTVTVNYKPRGTSLQVNVFRNTVIESFPVTFTCKADSVPPLSLELRFGSSPLGYFHNGTFALQHVNASNEGLYECVPRNLLGIGDIVALNLTVLAHPSIDYISHNTTANETNDICLFCNSTGNPRPNITWSLLEDPENVITSAKSLHLTNISANQAGMYQCTAANGVMRPDSANVQVTINYKPKIKGDLTLVTTSWINRKTEVTCEAVGFPIPDIVWTRNGTGSSSISSGASVSKFMFTPQNKDDFGVYVCIARNLLGSVRRNITIEQLVVPSAPEIVQIDAGFDSMEIHWKTSVDDPRNPVLSYLVQIKMNDESDSWMNCTGTTLDTSSGAMVCTVDYLKSDTEHLIRVSARNLVGYSTFTVEEARTKRREKKSRKEGLSGAAVDGIIGGIIALCVVGVLVVAIVVERRSRAKDALDSREMISNQATINSYDNPVITESPQ